MAMGQHDQALQCSRLEPLQLQLSWENKEICERQLHNGTGEGGWDTCKPPSTFLRLLGFLLVKSNPQTASQK